MATRRRFIRNCSALAASAVFFPDIVSAAPRRGRAISLSEVTFATLTRLIHSTFILRDRDSGIHGLELISAELALAESGESLECFSLVLRGDATRPLSQNTYVFEHSWLGRFEMFIVPVGRGDGRGCHYEAVFCRPAPLAGGSRWSHAAARPMNGGDVHG